MTKSIHIQQASLGYATGVILRQLNVDFYAGELLGVVGRNGVGKSTLLKSICGLLTPIEGHIRLMGSDTTKLSLQELARNVSVVLTERMAGFNLSTFDLVAAGQMPYTNSFHHLTETHRQIIEEAMQVCNIEAYRDKPLHELSDGLFQKASIARAVAQQTPIMLLDEPTAFLDFASKHKLFLLLRELCHQSKTILVSSHDLDLISRYCHKVLILEENACALLPVSELKNNEAFKRMTGGFL